MINDSDIFPGAILMLDYTGLKIHFCSNPRIILVLRKSQEYNPVSQRHLYDVLEDGVVYACDLDFYVVHCVPAMTRIVL